jgi:hypothetical protein
MIASTFFMAQKHLQVSSMARIWLAWVVPVTE